jgi:hypothetical protein
MRLEQGHGFSKTGTWIQCEPMGETDLLRHRRCPEAFHPYKVVSPAVPFVPGRSLIHSFSCPYDCALQNKPRS